jgi:hypothetical protein
MADVISAAADVATTLALIVSLFVAAVAARQLVESQRATTTQMELTRLQMLESRESVRIQSAFVLTNMLEDDANLAARLVVNDLGASRKPFKKWNDSDIEAAERVWRVFSVAANFQKMGAIPDDFLGKYYGPTVVRLWDTLAPFVHHRRAERGGVRVAGMFKDLAEEIRSRYDDYWWAPQQSRSTR